ncbi:MAG: CHAT domain-containing tetratricopeptide repeat protein [Burkholderiaceae bacterium]
MTLATSPCGWVQPRARVVVVLPEAASEDGLLVLDQQFVFKLSRKNTQTTLDAQALDTPGETGQGALVLAGNDHPLTAALGLARGGHACRFSLALDSLRPLDVSQAPSAVVHAQSMAAVMQDFADARLELRDRGNHKAALAPAQSAYERALRELGVDAPLTWIALNMVASIQWNLGEYRIALQLSMEAERELRRLLGEDAGATLAAQKEVELHRWENGELETARLGFERLRPKVDAHFGSESQIALALVNNLAVLYGELGRRDLEAEMLARVFLIRQRLDGPDARPTLLVLNNLAVALERSGRVDEGAALRSVALHRTRSAFGRLDPDTLRLEQNTLNRQCVNPSLECITAYESLLQAFSEGRGPQHPEALLTRQDLAIQLMKLDRPSEALPYIEYVYRSRLEKMTDRHWWTLVTQMVWLRVRLQLGDDSAIDEMGAVVARLENALGPAHIRVLEQLAQLSGGCRRAKLTCEQTTLERLVSRAEGARGISLLDGRQLNDAITTLLPAYLRLARLHAESGDMAAAVQIIERSKARTLLARLGLRRAQQTADLPAGEITRLDALEKQIGKLEEERSRTVQLDRIAAIEVRQAELATDFAANRARLRGLFPRYAAASSVDVPTTDTLIAALGQSERFIGYALTSEGLLIYTAARGAPLVVKFVEDRHLGANVAVWRSLLIAPNEADRLWALPEGRFVLAPGAPAADARPARIEDLSARLVQTLLAPVANVIPAGPAAGKRLVISPDGALATLPFESLPWRNTLLGAAVDLHYAQSLAVYRLLRERRPMRTQQRSLLAVGAPTYGHSAPVPPDATQDAITSVVPGLRGGVDLSALARSGAAPQLAEGVFASLGITWSPLPGTEREARAVAAMFAGSDLLLGDAASEDALIDRNARGELARYRYLLFATHGYLSTEAPTLSALVLRQPGTAQADGYVTAAEWANYSLKSDLIVMSGCETGLGKVVAGEGVMGLPYALFIAGNRNTLLSLWKVPDASTAEFMIRFFRKLRAGQSEAAALGATKREFMRDARWRNPIHWAGFVLYGA